MWKITSFSQHGKSCKQKKSKSLIPRNPQMNIQQLKERKNVYLIQTLSDKSLKIGIPIFAWRIT